MLDLLQEHETLTATEMSGYVDESPTNCAYHLRTLHRYGFVDEAPGGKGRERKWRHRPREVFVDNVASNPAMDAAVEVADLARDAFEAERLRQWRARSRSVPPEWRQSSMEARFDITMSAAEARALNAELISVVRRHIDDRTSPKADRAQVSVSLTTFPFGSELPTTEESEG